MATVADYQARIAAIDAEFDRILTQGGAFSFAKYVENGDVGFEIDPSKGMEFLLKLRSTYEKAMLDPAQSSDAVAYEITQMVDYYRVLPGQVYYADGSPTP